MYKWKEEVKEVIKNCYWTTSDGVDIKLKNMKLSHLKNCINMCKRKNLNDDVRILSCALAIKENRYDEFIDNDNLSDLIYYTCDADELPFNKEMIV